MNVETMLRDKVKPELNYLFTEVPAWRDGGYDFGWYCREHAYVSYFVCRLLSLRARIHCGDVSLAGPEGEMLLSTFGEDSDHAWISLEDTCPVDLSVVLRHFGWTVPELAIVFGVGRRGEYIVSYSSEMESVVKEPLRTRLYHLQYVEHSVLDVPPVELLDNPYVFLHKPPGGGLTQELGDDIYEKIIYHVYRVAIGELGPYFRYISDQVSSLKRIANKNAHASRKLRTLLFQELR